jgi:hypothetical protein
MPLPARAIACFASLREISREGFGRELSRTARSSQSKAKKEECGLSFLLAAWRLGINSQCSAVLFAASQLSARFSPVEYSAEKHGCFLIASWRAAW